MSSSSPLLQVKKLSTHFFTDHGRIKAVEDVSYDVAPGETLAIVGESGCGKSVGALSILGLIPNPPGKIVAGEVWFEGRNLLQLSKSEMCGIRGNRVAMIFQDPVTSLNPVLTIGRQLMEPLRLHNGLSDAAARQKAVSLLEKVHIAEAEKRMDVYPHQLSGGMCQRVMIAMAIACSPKLIIADEPTTALDVTIQAQLLELMKQLTRDIGSALILITHNLGIVARYADRVNVMYAGRIVEKAPADELYSSPCHPYTCGLLASVPRLDQDVHQRLKPIEGQPPDLSRLPEGCAFYTRCPRRMDRCMKNIPRLRETAMHHEAACWAVNGN